MANETRPNTFENIVNLVKAVVWPLIFVYVLLQYNGPVAQTLALFPDLVKHATKLTAGGITLEIEQKALETGNQALALALKGLSPNARKLLLRVNESYWSVWDPETKSDRPEDRRYFSLDRPELKEL